jgi:hypothetical protein
MIGEWVLLSLAHAAGSARLGDAISEALLYPAARSLIQQCDSILRIEAASKGADADLSAARNPGLPVYYRVGDMPAASANDRSIE